MKKDVIAIIPAYNEEAKIGDTVSKTLGYVDEVVVVNDGSSDKTAEKAKLSGATLLSHPNNKGAGASIRTGINYAIENGCSTIIVLGGDDQDNPAEIPMLLKSIEDGYDFVQGSRYLKGIKNQPFFRTLSTRLFTAFFKLATKQKVTDASNGFRAFKVNVVRSIDISPDWLNKYELEPYLLIQTLKSKFKYKEVPVSKYYGRKKGYSKMKPIVSWYSICRPMLREFFKFKL